MECLADRENKPPTRQTHIHSIKPLSPPWNACDISWHTTHSPQSPPAPPPSAPHLSPSPPASSSSTSARSDRSFWFRSILPKFRGGICCPQTARPWNRTLSRRWGRAISSGLICRTIETPDHGWETATRLLKRTRLRGGIFEILGV